MSEIARAVGSEVSSTQRALELLVDEGHVIRSRREYALSSRPVTLALLVLATDQQPVTRPLEAVLRANRGVEFACEDDAGWLVVMARSTEAADQVALEGAADRFATAQIEVVDHDEVRERLIEDNGPRERALRARLVKGRVERSLPDRRSRSSFESARRLGDLNPALRRPSRRDLATIARRFGLVHLTVFGSAVRDDFRPDSDVDVFVEHRPEVDRTAGSMITLRDELERVFDRDVDVIEGSLLRPAIRRVAQEEGVALL